MKIYDETIAKVMILFEEQPLRELSVEDPPWEDAGRHNLVLRNEMAYELGAQNLPAVAFLGVTSSSTVVIRDQIIICGQDLTQIKHDMPYARITLLQVNEHLIGSKTQLYYSMERLMQTRYNVNPRGFMTRIAGGRNHEPVRVSQQAINQGISFSTIGQLYINAYKQHPAVQAVKVIFVTAPAFNYQQLSELANKNEQITKAFDHVLRDFKMDCSTCNLQNLCNEVDGMKELHFSSNY